jgi:hypothetical protein
LTLLEAGVLANSRETVAGGGMDVKEPRGAGCLFKVHPATVSRLLAKAYAK